MTPSPKQNPATPDIAPANEDVLTCTECQINVFAPTGRCPMCNHPVRAVDPNAPAAVSKDSKHSIIRNPVVLGMVGIVLVIAIKLLS